MIILDSGGPVSQVELPEEVIAWLERADDLIEDLRNSAEKTPASIRGELEASA